MVLGEGFGRKEVEYAVIGIGKRLLNRGQVVAEGLAAGSSGGNHQVFSIVSSLDCFSLVRIQVGYSKRIQRGVQAGIQRSGNWGTDCLARGRDLPVGYVFPKFLILLPAINQRADTSTALVLLEVIYQVGLSF